MTFTWLLSCRAPKELGVQYWTWQPKIWTRVKDPKVAAHTSIKIQTTIMHYSLISQCCCLAKAEQRCCYGCWVSLSVRHSRVLSTNVLALKTAWSCLTLFSQKWDVWWTSTPTGPASPWNKLELLSSWAPTLQSLYCPTGACQPTVHTAGDKKDEGREGEEKQTLGGVRMIRCQSLERRRDSSPDTSQGWG